MACLCGLSALNASKGGLNASKGGRNASKGGRIASKGGRIASKGGRIASKRGWVLRAKEGQLRVKEGGRGAVIEASPAQFWWVSLSQRFFSYIPSTVLVLTFPVRQNRSHVVRSCRNGL